MSFTDRAKKLISAQEEKDLRLEALDRLRCEICLRQMKDHVLEGKLLIFRAEGAQCVRGPQF